MEPNGNTTDLTNKTPLEILKAKLKLDTYKTHEFLPDVYLTSFLASSKNDINTASQHIRTYLNFRQIYCGTPTPEDPLPKVPKSDIQKLIDVNYAQWYGMNKNSSPCVVVKSKNMISKNHSVDSLVKLFIYIIDEGMMLISKGCDIGTEKGCSIRKFCVIGDRDDYDKDKHFSKEFSEAIKPYGKSIFGMLLPILDMVYIVNISWFWRMMFGIAKKFVEPHILKKIIMLGDKDDLRKYFYNEELMVEYRSGN